MKMIERVELSLTMVEGLSVSSEIDDMVRQSICRHLKKVLRELYDERNRILDAIERKSKQDER